MQVNRIANTAYTNSVYYRLKTDYWLIKW
jgi:hypothetical protein